MATGRQRGKAAERRVARASGGERVPYSGAGSVKGDVHTARVFYEVKSSASRVGEVKSIRLQKDWLTKMQKQAAKEGKPLAALVVHFHGDQRDWVVMAWEQWEGLIRDLPD